MTTKRPEVPAPPQSARPSPARVAKYLVSLIIVLFLAAVAAQAVTIIGPGERGVLLRWGAVTGTVFNEGLSFKLPIAETVDTMDVKTSKIETQASAASKDLQVVTSTIALNVRVRPEQVVWLRQNIGLDYRSKIIDPAIQEAIKAATAQFTAEELITKRPLVREQMKINLQEKLDSLSGGSVAVEEFNVIDFDFSEEFNRAIESKVTAEQLALKAERDLDRIKIEAQQKIEQAKAEAESLRIQSAALRDNPDILQLRWIEKWNGNLPQYLGDSEGIILSLPK
ncbi:MAG: prohibitin family protein [Candidatus Aenigmarchaeota archaeon]|nr:prohibitin family protein [Candidatus Aenigmarchaeota archaeon]